MPLFALILFVLFGLVVLTGVILALIAGIRPAPRFDLRRLFPAPPPNDFFSLIRVLFSQMYGREFPFCFVPTCDFKLAGG